MGDRAVWWLGIVIAVANLAVGLWDVARGDALGAFVCFTVCGFLVVSCVFGSDLRRHP